MINNSFDDKSKAIVNPDQTIKEEEKQIAANVTIDTFIIVFSHQLIDLLFKNNKIEIIDPNLTIGSAAFKNHIYKIPNSNTGVVLSGIGAPMAVAIVEELNVLFNAKNYIVFGSCGALFDIAEGKLIVIDEAYRDEGTSYHYIQASDYIKIKTANALTKILDELEIEYVVGKSWTTDAFYRETENNKTKRVKEGCICVEMECSALQAVCDFRGLNLYQFVYAADSLNEKWARRILGNLEKDARLLYFNVAKKIAEKI